MRVPKKMLDTLLISHVNHVLVVGQQKDLNQSNVIIVREEVKLEPTKVFLQFNKLALSAAVMEK